MDYEEKFNTTFLELLDDLIRTFPNDGEFPLYALGAKTALMADRSLLRTKFREHIGTIFGDKILAKDDGFFLNQDYTNLTGGVDNATAIVEKLKGYWGQLDTSNRDVIWKYLRILVMLDRKCDA